MEAAARAGSSESISKDGKSQLANEDLSQVTNAMQHAGHKHIMFNGLREAILTDVEYEGWKAPLQNRTAII